MTPLGKHPGIDLTIIVDVANVMGARADGWWKDRAAAALRLRHEVSALARRGLAVTDLPREAAGDLAAGERCYPGWVLVLEGRARAAAAASDVDGDADGLDVTPLVRLVLAPGSGDDAIAEQAAGLRGWRIVVTADRELRRRCEQSGAVVTGPRWLLGLLAGVI